MKVGGATSYILGKVHGTVTLSWEDGTGYHEIGALSGGCLLIRGLRVPAVG